MSCGTTESACGYPLWRRLRVLESLAFTGAIALVETHPGEADAVLDLARHHFLEGAVVKRRDSVHRSGRLTASRLKAVSAAVIRWRAAARYANLGTAHTLS